MDRKSIIFPLIVLVLSSVAFAQSRGYDYFKSKTKIQDPFQLRDPFKRPFSGRKKEKNSKELKGLKSLNKNSLEVVNSKGVYSNIPTIGNTPLAQIRIVGVLIGDDRRAIAKIENTGGKLSADSFILKEGMKLGADDAELKAIMPGGIVVVEKIKNVYDQDEYIETVVPVSAE